RASAKLNGAEKGRDDYLLPLMLQEKQLLESFGDDHPAVISVRNRIALMRAHHEKKAPKEHDEKDPAKRLLQDLRDELNENDAALHTLTKLVEELKSEAKDTTNYEIKEEALRRAVSQSNDMYEATIKRLKEIDLVRDSIGIKSQLLAQPSTGARVAPSAF